MLRSLTLATPAHLTRRATARSTMSDHEHLLSLVRRMVPPLSHKLHKGQAGESPLLLFLLPSPSSQSVVCDERVR
jgi:hypothetical protein